MDEPADMLSGSESFSRSRVSEEVSSREWEVCLELCSRQEDETRRDGRESEEVREDEDDAGSVGVDVGVGRQIPEMDLRRRWEARSSAFCG